MELQDGSGNLGGHGAAEGLVENLLLVGAGGYQNHLPGCHHGADAHGVSSGGNLVNGVEEALVGLTGNLLQLYLMGHGREMVGGLVEADVAVVANAQQLQVHPAPLLNLLLISLAHGRHVLGLAVGNDGVLGLDVHMIEQVLLHEVPVALGMVPGQALVLVQVGGTNPGKINLTGLAALHQLPVQGQGAGTGSQAQNTGGLGLDQGLEQVGSDLAHLLRVLDFDNSCVNHGNPLLYNVPSYYH